MRAVSWGVTLLVAVVAIPFAVSNRQLVSLGLWPLPFLVDLPLYLLVLLMLLAGFVVGVSAAWIAGRRLRRELRRRRRRVQALERELAATQSRLEDQAIGSDPERFGRSERVTFC
jgi:lipopolysaccharide assembly protein A